METRGIDRLWRKRSFCSPSSIGHDGPTRRHQHALSAVWSVCQLHKVVAQNESLQSMQNSKVLFSGLSVVALEEGSQTELRESTALYSVQEHERERWLSHDPRRMQRAGGSFVRTREYPQRRCRSLLPGVFYRCCRSWWLFHSVKLKS